MLVETVNTVHSKVLRMEGNHASKFVSPSVERSAPQILWHPSRMVNGLP